MSSGKKNGDMEGSSCEKMSTIRAGGGQEA